MTPREDILKEAQVLISNDRNTDYGAPKDNMQNTADLVNTVFDTDFSARDMAMIMVLVKISRMRKSPSKRDHYADLLGYGAIAFECLDGSETKGAKGE